MAEPTTPNNNAPGGGGDPPVQPAGGTGDQSQQAKTFTQEQLDAILADRLTRERQKFADYDELKSAAAKWQEAQDAQKSEADKLKDDLAKAQSDRDQALKRAQETLIRSAFIAAGADANLVNPDDAYRLGDLSTVTIEDDGTVKGVAEIVKGLVDGGRLPIKGKLPAPNLNGSAGTNQRPGASAEALTAEELETARKMGITPEEYQKFKQKA